MKTNKIMKNKNKRLSEMILKTKTTFHNLPMTKTKSLTNSSKKKEESLKKSTKNFKEILKERKFLKSISEMSTNNF